MRLEQIEIRRVTLALRFPFETSFGRTTAKQFLLVSVSAGGVVGHALGVAGDAVRGSGDQQELLGRGAPEGGLERRPQLQAEPSHFEPLELHVARPSGRGRAAAL